MGWIRDDEKYVEYGRHISMNKTQKLQTAIVIGLSINPEPQLFWNILFAYKLRKVGIVDFNFFQAIDKSGLLLVQGIDNADVGNSWKRDSKIQNFYFNLSFWKLDLEFDNVRGGKPQSIIVAYLFMSAHRYSSQIRVVYTSGSV
jgi:hypothetical protein